MEKNDIPLDTTETFLDRGISLTDEGDYDRAIADFTNAIGLDQNLFAAYAQRGRAYWLRKDYDKAIEDCNKAIEIDSNYAPAYNYRGNAYKDKGNYDLAISDYTEAIKLDPNDDDSKHWLEKVQTLLSTDKKSRSPLTASTFINITADILYDRFPFVYLTFSLIQ